MHRTNTTQLTVFQRPAPNAATFTFSSPDTIRISIPFGSKFDIRTHWHYTDLDTSKLTWVSGGPVIVSFGPRDKNRSASHSGARGFSHSCQLDEATSWGVLYNRNSANLEELLVVDIEANTKLHRNICSAILDRDKFPRLASTPFWIKGLFVLLSASSRLQEWLLEAMLRVQLQTIYYAHDYHIFHGRIPFDMFFVWPLTPEVPRATQLAFRSRFWVSKIVMSSCYWVGRILLGMRGEYEEYTPECRAQG
ncbi:hypothetical protein CKM354_000825800 [Cercospora kikuchii]|uniref:Uncharacterized protein n=1 Tax=Cercospora kikuchii TaxID=84275 RepID=A0A9P3FJB5_9PEZI|nr:uncharacterized protein CKM354_000825800 [Cercospora kikuchii]GIZ45074.1 hypothetical protein CKM354_000825800 [Cercospora kikuchii]